MLIKQSRIKNLSKLSFIKDNTLTRIGVTNIARFSDKYKTIGFPIELNAGQTVLPKVIGPITRRNSEGFIILNRDKEKEICYRMVEWTYNQWAGRGETVEVTESTVVPYKRYPRTILPPPSIELTVTNGNNNELIIVSPEFQFNKENDKLIIHIINLFLEIFGECQVFDSNKNSIAIPRLIRLNWEVLPKGKMPWEQRKNQIKKFIDKVRGDNKKVVIKRLETINKYNPDFTAIGNAGFSGYIVHGFIDKDIYILESIYTNNATYIFGDNWESISKLTKAEILNSNLHKDRVIHAKDWYERMETILNEII